MGEGVINGGNARVVLIEVAGIQSVRAMSDWSRVEFHLMLQRCDQRLDDILTEALALQNDCANLRQYNGVEH
ncbi:hypothetical protein D3C73_1286920 [compost metagenome]